MQEASHTRHLLTRLDEQFKSLERILVGFGEEAFAWSPADGTWSAARHLAHLTRYHEMSDARITRILTESDPVLDRYSAENDPDWPRWKSVSSAVNMERLTGLRANLVERLSQLPADAYARRGIHPAFGPMSLTDWLEFFLAHEGHHMYAIFHRLRSAPKTC